MAIEEKRPLVAAVKNELKELQSRRTLEELKEAIVELEEEEGRICQCLPELFLEFVGVPCGVFHGVSLSWIYPINVRARGSVPDRVIGG